MQIKITDLYKVAAFLFFTSLPPAAFAQRAGDTLFSAGLIRIVPQDSSGPLTVGSPYVRVIPGSGSTVGNSDTMGLSLTHFYTDNLALVADLGVPPTVKLYGSGALSSVGELGSANKLAPAALLKYYFG